MKWGRWSTTAASNSASPPDGWPEGQVPSTVNDCAREMMAAIKVGINEAAQGFFDLDLSPTYVSSNSFTMPNDQTTFFGIGRRVKAFDAVNQYGTVISSTFTTNTFVQLRLDGSGLLTGSLSAVGVAMSPQFNPIPDTVFRQFSVINNPIMDFWQRTATVALSVGVSTIYTADHWANFTTVTAGHAITIFRAERSAAAANVPTLAQSGFQLQNSMCVSLSGTTAVIGAAQFGMIRYIVEGTKYKNIAHKPNVLQFWTKSNRTGTYCVAFRNNGNDRSYVAEYQISANNTWEKKTVFVPEAPTTGTWNYDFSVGVQITWALAAGSGLQTTTAGQWTATNAMATANQCNWYSSTGATMFLTGVDLKEGTTELPLTFMDPVQDLDELQRVYKTVEGGTSWMGNSSPGGTFGTFYVPFGGRKLAQGHNMQVTLPAAAKFALKNFARVTQTIQNVTVTVSNRQGCNIVASAAGASLGSSSLCWLSLSSDSVIVISAEI